MLRQDDDVDAWLSVTVHQALPLQHVRHRTGKIGHVRFVLEEDILQEIVWRTEVPRLMYATAPSSGGKTPMHTSLYRCNQMDCGGYPYLDLGVHDHACDLAA